MLIPNKINLCSKHVEKMISIKINSACNMGCSFCVDVNGRDTKNISVEKIVSEAKKLDEYKTIIITGGEPFLNFKEVVQLLYELRPFKKRSVLNTNGSLLTKEKADSLNGLIDELQVSVHHYDEKRNSNVFGSLINFENIKNSLANREFIFSINSTFNPEYTKEERSTAVDKMIELCNYFNADRLRLTELKKVSEKLFVPANEFFKKDDKFTLTPSNELIEKGCHIHYKKYGVDVSVKRLCDYAKGINALAFSCCFIDTDGQRKIDVDTKDTFKVIYGDGLVTDDWIFKAGKQ